MTHLANAIRDLMAKRSFTQSDLSRMTGLFPSRISRLMAGQRYITHKDFTRISQALTSDPVEAASLVQAYLRDECYGPGSELVSVGINLDRAGSPAWLQDVARLSPRTQQALRSLVFKAEKRPSMERLLILLADTLEQAGEIRREDS